jgi:CHAD domain-containing protein
MAARRPPPVAKRVRYAPGSARVRNAILEQQRRLRTTATRLDMAGVNEIHDGRVAARRLRSMLKTFRPLLDADRARLYREDLRGFARTLGEAREADVRRELLTALSLDDGRVSPSAHRRLVGLLERSCVASRERLGLQLAAPEWAALCAALDRQRAGEALIVERSADMAQVLALVARAWRRPLRLLRRGPRDVAELHELRLAFKHCRYALEPVADIAPREGARLLRRLRAAQDCIGEHRDTLLAEHWVQENEPALGPALVSRLDAGLRAREKALRRDAARRAARVLGAWKDWQAVTRPVRKAGSPGPA